MCVLALVFLTSLAEMVSDESFCSQDSQEEPSSDEISAWVGVGGRARFLNLLLAW